MPCSPDVLKQVPLFADMPDSPLPPLRLLDQPAREVETLSAETLEFTSRLIERKLADFGVAAKPFGSQADFLRLLSRNSTYHPVGHKLVLARTVLFGYQQSLSTNPNLPSNQQIPLPERFFAGGASTHRGFPENQAGPRDPVTGFPLGGSALLLFGTELRFPLIGENIGGVLFHDAGNVYSRIENLSFRVSQRDVSDFDYMVHAIGLGIRFRTPIGPIRVDLAFGPNSPRFIGCKGTRDELLFGACEAVPQRINRFQFHFSLGQTF